MSSTFARPGSPLLQKNLWRFCWVLAASCAVWIVCVVVLMRYGLPDLQGQTPLFQYIALNQISYPAATVGLPLLYSALTRERLTRQSLRAVTQVLFNCLWLSPFLAVFMKYAAEGKIGRIETQGPVDLVGGALSCVLYLLVADFFFYWTHRAVHTRRLYWLHKHHHSYRTPTEAVTLNALSAIDLIIESASIAILPALIVPVHIAVWGIAFGITLFIAILDHSFTSLTFRIPFLGGPQQHQIHHRLGVENCNYALVFKLWDRVFGTFRAYSPELIKRGPKKAKSL